MDQTLSALQTIAFISRLFIGISCLVFFSVKSIGQGSAVPLGNDSYHIFNRLSILTGIPMDVHPSINTYLRGDLVRYAMHLDTSATNLSQLDREDLNYIFRDNNEWLIQTEYPTTLTGANEPILRRVYTDSSQTFYRLEETESGIANTSPYYIRSRKPIWKYFYRTPANFFELDRPFFQLRINPIIDFRMAKAQDDDELIFYNRRGIEVRGGIDDRVYFYSNILETQARFPDYVSDRIERDKAVPGATLYKEYESSIFDITNGYDFLIAQGYLGFNLTRHIGMQIGHGQNFIGNGYRSLLLSDFSANYLYIKLNTRVWKFHYQNIFAELSAESVNTRPGSTSVPRKYLAAHYFNYQITPKFSLGLFEAVVYSRNNDFEFQYLNPVIFYRTIEGAIGSPDNVLIGLNGRWDLFNRFQLYGQLMLDEFKFDELFIERRGWWANKYGIQVGVKYINTFGIDHFDTQVEFNSARPYTFTHRDSSTSYAHENQPLAHPLGANFRELILRGRYQPTHKWRLDGRLMFAEFGEDNDTTNWGSNLLLPHTTRELDFGNEIGQGINSEVILLGLDISYQIRHNIFLELNYFYRRQDSADNSRDRTTQYFGGGFRMNIAHRNNDF